MNNKDKLFIGTEIVKAIENNVAIKLLPKKTVSRCSGFFCEEPAQLAVATNRENHEEFGIFIHESCHMDQWLEQTELWLQPVLNGPEDIMAQYTTGKRTRKTKVVKSYLQAMLKLEIDCEIRALEKIKKYNLSIPLDDYARKANCYMYSYRSFYETSLWHKRPHVPSKDPVIMAQMPTEILTFKEYWKGHDLIHDLLLKYGKK